MGQPLQEKQPFNNEEKKQSPRTAFFLENIVLTRKNLSFKLNEVLKENSEYNACIIFVDVL